MAQKTKGVFDDALATLPMLDIQGGMNTQDGALSLASNETPMCNNVIGFPGRTIYVGGYNLLTGLPSGDTGDGGWQFYDINNAKHIIAWAGGNMFDTVNGIQTLIASGVYNGGQNIGRGDANGVLYWCTATTPLQMYDGATNSAVISSGDTGAVAIPTGTCLCIYAGSVVIGNPGIGGFANPGSIIASNVNDPTTFLGTTLTATGENNFVQFLIPMGVSAAGVPPTSSIMIGGKQTLILAQGPVNSFKLNDVNVPQGCQDGNSAQYIPTGDLLGAVIYLGNDNQWWNTNGISGDCITKKILDFCNLTIQANIQENVVQRFWGAYNARYQYYLCDLGQNQQLIYRWQTKAWYLIQGWPSGAYINGTTGIGFPTNYSVANGVNSPGVYQVGQDSESFGGVIPNIFFQTPYLHANTKTITKEWQWFNLLMNNTVPAAYQVVATGLSTQNGFTPITNPLVFMNPEFAVALGNTGIWDVSKWDQAIWGGGETFTTQMPYNAAGMLTVPVPADGEWVLFDTTQPLRSPAVSFKISWTNGGNANALPGFDILGAETRYKQMGHYTTGGPLYSAESGVLPSGSDPFNTGN